MLPSSEDDTARIESSITGRQRASASGGAKPNSQSVITGRSISRNSERNVSVTSESTEPNTAGDAEQRARGIRQAGGEVLEQLGDRVVRVGRREDVLEAGLGGQLVPVRRQRVDEVDDLVPHRPGGQEHEREDGDEQRRRRRPARPFRASSRAARACHDRVEAEGRTAARRIEISVPSESSASATSTPNPSSMSSVRAGKMISTRCGRGGSACGCNLSRRHAARRHRPIIAPGFPGSITRSG